MISGRTYYEESELKAEEYLTEHYFKPRQWVSYCGQVDAIKKLSPTTLLEIGVGSGIVCKILEHIGINVTSFDINPNLNPSVVGNITELKKYFKENEFDTTLCAEVLEHIPFDLFEICLKNIAYVTAKTAVITIPKAGKNLLFCNGQIPRKAFDISLRIPTTSIAKVHHWEINSSKHSNIKNLLAIMKKYFIVKNYYRIPGHINHYLFVLEKHSYY